MVENVYSNVGVAITRNSHTPKPFQSQMVQSAGVVNTLEERTGRASLVLGTPETCLPAILGMFPGQLYQSGIFVCIP